MLVKSAVLALALGGAAFSTAAYAEDAMHSSNMDSARHDNMGVALDFGTVAYGYNDGYWDNGHRWHAWSNDAEMTGYRAYHGNNYHDWHHDRDHNLGWLRN
jgi:hypothetical protein